MSFEPVNCGNAGTARNSQGLSPVLNALVACISVLVGCSALQAGPFGPVTWGDTVSIGGGWARLVPITNGHWLGVVTAYPAGTNTYLRIIQSFDNCRHWSALSNVSEPGRTLDNGELLLLPSGEVLLSMRSLIPNVSYRLPVYVSGNKGLSWVYRSNVDAIEGAVAQAGHGLWEPDLWTLHDGRLIVTYSNEGHPGYSQLISERVSTDNGVTWGAESWPVFASGAGDLRPGMPQIARMANGKYILVYEIVPLGVADVYYKVSDDGTTWPAGLGTRIPCQHGAPFIISLPNGVLLLTSNENVLSFSEDFGLTWQKAEPAIWPGGLALCWPSIYSTRADEIVASGDPASIKLKFGALSPRPKWPNPVQTDFNTGTDPGWSRYGGNFAFGDGRYLLSNEGTYGKAMMGDAFWRDGVLEADLMITSPGNAGLMFRTTNPDYAGPDHALGYYVGLDTAGFVILGAMSNAWNPIASATVSVGLNTWHHLKVTMQGTAIAAYVDDMAVPNLSLAHGSYARGQVGVRAFQCDAQFDNVTFSNSVPLDLELGRSADQLRFTWPETSVSVKLMAGETTSNGVPQLGDLTLSNGKWQQTIPKPLAPLQLYWLRAE